MAVQDNPNRTTAARSGGFADYFSRSSQLYARHRPRYPQELFAYLAGQAPGRRLAWDCGTGSGQAALGLAQEFERVFATDASPDQVSTAIHATGIEYRAEPADQVSLATDSVDLVTAAIAVHWFDRRAFWAEARRVLKPQGVVAVWAYSLPQIDPQVDRIVKEMAEDVLGDYWPDQVKSLSDQYQTLTFPFDEIEPPEFVMVTEWDLGRLLGFIDSWSGTRIFLEIEGVHPVQPLAGKLKQAWGAGNVARTAHWPLVMRVGRNGPHAGQTSAAWQGS